MYTVESLATGVERLHRLRMFLGTLPAEKYHHQDFIHECGTPGCAVGWATVALPEVFETCHWNQTGDRLAVRRRGSTLAPVYSGSVYAEAADGFLISFTVSEYVFGYCVTRNGRYHLNRGPDHSVATTLRRLDLVLGYLRRRLAMLLAEAESSRVAKHRALTCQVVAAHGPCGGKDALASRRRKKRTRLAVS